MNDIDSGAGSPSTASNAAASLILTQYVRGADDMKALHARFQRYREGMDFDAFEKTLIECFPSLPHAVKVTPPDAEVGSSTPASSPKAGSTRAETPALPIRLRRQLARLELAGAVVTDPLRLLFRRIDKANDGTVTWDDVLAYMVTEAASAGVLSSVRDDYRPYTASRIRRSRPMPETPATGMTSVKDISAAALNSSDPAVTAAALAGDPDRLAAISRAKQAELHERQRVLRNVWRGQQNKYGGKHIPGAAAAAAAASMATGDEPREGVVYESSDLAFVEFLDALPTNPIAFAVCGRYRPLSLYSKTTFDLLRCFTDAELGNVQPSKVAYIASSDTLLVYSAVDGQIRSFTGLFQSPQVSTLTPYVVTAGLLQCMRQVPVEHPDCVFIAGSHGSIHQLRIPNRYNTEADNSDNELSLSDRTRREISVVREFDKIHDRVEGGITDFVMSATHFFSCGFDRKLISTSIATGVSTVIGLPDEAIRCLGYNDAFNAILAVSFTTGALSLWDARATGVVQGSKFEGGGTTTSEDQPEGMQDNGGEEQRCLHIIGIECPADMPHAITADADGAIRVWDLRSRTCLQKVSADGTGDESELTEPDSVYGRGGRVENRLRQSANPLTGGSGRRSAKGSRNTSAGESVRVGSASRGFDLSTKIEEPKYSSLSNSTGTAASMGSITRKSSPGRFSVLRSLAYFGATREIVTCTADTVYTLRHNQRRNDALCDLDLTLDVVHIVRGVGGRQQSQAFGQFLLRGPSRLSLWDVEHGFRTRHVDRALIPALPASRQEVVAFSVDDVTNRVFLSFPDGALEVHNLEDVFDVDLTGRDVPFEGSVIIAGKGASVSAGWEVVTELKYLGDHQLLLGLTSQGRLLLYSEATNDNYLNYISPSPGSTVYLSNLSSSDEVELCAFTAGDEAVAGGDGTTQTGSGKKGSRIFIHHYRRVGGDFAASTQLTLNRPVTQLLFLERLPLLLSAHSYGDVTLWSCPPVKPNFVPVATLNVFSAGPHRVPLQFQAETIQQLHSPLNKSPPKEVRGGGGGGDSNGSSTTAQPAHGKKESSPSDKPAKDGLPPLASSMTTRSRSRVVSVVNVERPSVLRASLTQQHDNVNAEESQYARTCSSETTMYTLPEILGGGSLRPETEKAGGVPPDDSGLRLVDGSGDREVTAVTFDGRSHTLFFGDSDGSLHFYSLCPTIQLYGLRPCRFECRAQYPARTLPSSPNASESARPLFLTRCVAHDGVSSTIGSSPAVIALAWLPFLNVLVSSGEDRTVVLFNRHAERLGNLSAAQLPPETAVSSKDNSPLRGNNGSRAPYVLPQRTAVDRTQFINDFFGASDEQDACKKNGCELVSSAAAICVPVEPSKYSSPIPTCKLSSEAAVSHKSSSVKPRYPLAEDLRGALQENPKYSASIRPGTAGTRPGTGPSLGTPASPNRETGVTKKGTRDGGTSELRSTEVAGGAGSRTSHWSDSLPTDVLRAVPGKKPASDLLARQAPGSATWPRPVFASDDPEYVEMISVNPTMASLVDRNREEEAASMRTKMSGTRKEAVDTSDPCVPLFRAPPVVELTGPNSLVVDIVPEVQLMAAREPSADTVVTAVTDEVPTALSLSRAQTPVAFVEEALTPQLVPSREPSPRLPAQYVTEVDREPIHSEELGFHAAITGHCALPQPPHTQPCTNTRGLKSTRHHRGDNDGIGGGDSGKLRRGCTCRSPVPPSFVRKQKETLTWRATNTAASPPREKKRTPRPLPGTSEALDIRVNVYGGELKRCLKARSLGKPAPGMETPWSCATDDAASQRAL